MMDRQEKAIAGMKACMHDRCEDCPYVAAAEECSSDLQKDLQWFVNASGESVRWAQHAVRWLRYQEPDTLITMVDSIGRVPDLLWQREDSRDAEHS